MTKTKSKRTVKLVSKSGKGIPVSVNLDAELRDKLEAFAAAHNFTVPELITLCLRMAMSFAD
jgi:hypothetical protein